MRNLDVLPDDPLAVYDAIVDSKEGPRKARLAGLRPRIACAYLRYYAHRPALELLRRLGRRVRSDEAEDLLHCYDGMSDNRSPLYARYYARILALARYDCAYCGIHKARTLDHFLPKERRRGYPELAVLPANLVPSCGDCNPPRDFRDGSGHRAIIHPYFDTIVQEPLLTAVVSIVGGVPEVEFRVDPSACSDPAFGRLFERHVHHLRLLERYRQRAMLPDDGLSRIQLTLRTWGKGAPRAEVTQNLLMEAEDHERKLGANHFWTALKRGVAASEGFLDFCLPDEAEWTTAPNQSADACLGEHQ